MENNNYPDDIVRGLKEQNDTLHAEKERTLKYADEMALKFCEMRNSKDAQLKAQRDLLEECRLVLNEIYDVCADLRIQTSVPIGVQAKQMVQKLTAALSSKGEI